MTRTPSIGTRTSPDFTRTRSWIRVATALLAACILVPGPHPTEAVATGSAISDAAKAAGRVLFLNESFEGAPAGEIPKGWVASETNGAGTRATWKVTRRDAEEQTTGLHILQVTNARNTGERFNLLLSQAQFANSFRMGVYLRADSGQEDQGGGLLWHCVDKHNYYAVRWNPLERNVRVYHVKDGNRILLMDMGVNVNDPDRPWHHLDVEVREHVVKVSIDNYATFSCFATPLTDRGRVGFWTKADACTSFDSFYFKN